LSHAAVVSHFASDASPDPDGGALTALLSGAAALDGACAVLRELVLAQAELVAALADVHDDIAELHRRVDALAAGRQDGTLSTVPGRLPSAQRAAEELLDQRAA
jgi:hypothetical protein